MRGFLDAGYERAAAKLRKDRATLDALVHALLEQETLDEAALARILSGQSSAA